MSLTVQWITLISMLGSGFCLGVILDFYHAVKERFSLRGWFVSLLDLCYWFVAAGLIFSLLLYSNWGQLRFYVFLCVLLGIYLYYRWFHKSVRAGILRLFSFLEQLVRFVFRLLKPFYLLGKWIFSLFQSFLVRIRSASRRLLTLIGSIFHKKGRRK